MSAPEQPNCSPASLRDADTCWTIWIRHDSTDNFERSEFFNTDAHVYWFEGGIVIQTRPTGFGDYRDERVIPWAQVVELKKEALYGER